MRFSWVPLIAVGCSSGPGEQVVPLAEFSKLYIAASDQDPSFKVALDDGGGSPRWGACPVVDATLTAQLDDVSVPVVSRGRKIGESPGDDVDDNDCEPPSLALRAPLPDGVSTLTLTDGATTVICHLPDLKATRQMTLLSADQTWTWRPGQDVAVQWSPSGDLGLWKVFILEMLHLTAPNVIDDLVDIRDVTIEGDVLRFSVPSSLPPGSYILELIPPRSVACGSPLPVAEILSTSPPFGASHPVTIAP
jgi:hypothetical protein